MKGRCSLLLPVRSDAVLSNSGDDCCAVILRSVSFVFLVGSALLQLLLVLLLLSLLMLLFVAVVVTSVASVARSREGLTSLPVTKKNHRAACEYVHRKTVVIRSA